MSEVFRIGYDFKSSNHKCIKADIVWLDTFADSSHDCLLILNAFRGAFKDFDFCCKNLVSKNIYTYEEFKKTYGFE